MAVVLVNDQDFHSQLKQGELVVVKYMADWCGSCKMFAPKYKRVSNEEAYGKVLFLEVDAENNPEARKAAGVDSLPYLAVFREGVLYEGAASSKEEYLRSILDKALTETA